MTVGENLIEGKTYNIQHVSLRFRLINTANILIIGLFLFCSQFQLDILEILVSIIITFIAFTVIGFIYKKTIPIETVILSSKGFSYSKKKNFPLKKEEYFFFEWKEIIGYQKFYIRSTTAFQLNFEDHTCFKFNHYNVLNNDDFDKMYADLQKYTPLFSSSDNPTPKGITIYETPAIKLVMILITFFVIFISYHSISQPSEGSMIIIAIFGSASLYFWYRVLDIWSKKRQ